MKRIGNIFLTWRKGPGSRRIAVAKISQGATSETRFQYIQENLPKAQKEGFNHYTGFPKTDIVYEENVLAILSQRIARSERNDLSEYYDFWCVDRDLKNDVFYMLAQTQGLLPTDNFEFLADFNPIQGLVFITEISGLSYTKLSRNELQVGDSLSFQREHENNFDSKAVLLKKGDRELGYVKTIHSSVFYKSSSTTPSITVHHLERNGLIKRAFIRIEY